MAEASVGQTIYRVGEQFIRSGVLSSDCYTNVETNRGVCKPSLNVFYYANRGDVVGIKLIINVLYSCFS